MGSKRSGEPPEPVSASKKSRSTVVHQSKPTPTTTKPQGSSPAPAQVKMTRLPLPRSTKKQTDLYCSAPPPVPSQAKKAPAPPHQTSINQPEPSGAAPSPASGQVGRTKIPRPEQTNYKVELSVPAKYIPRSEARASKRLQTPATPGQPQASVPGPPAAHNNARKSSVPAVRSAPSSVYDVPRGSATSSDDEESVDDEGETSPKLPRVDGVGQVKTTSGALALYRSFAKRPEGLPIYVVEVCSTQPDLATPC
jgi:hypothetical protein